MRIRLLGVALAALAVGGCAFTNPDNTPLLTLLDGALEPASTGAKVALAPVFIPVGVTCGALDIGVLHPIQSLGLAAEDTYAALWSQPEGPLGRQVALAFPKAAFTPVVYAACWLGESLFDLHPRNAEGSR